MTYSHLPNNVNMKKDGKKTNRFFETECAYAYQ